MAKRGADYTPHPNWQPQPVFTPWDGLLAGVKTPDDWPARRADIRRRFLEILCADAAPQPPAQVDLRVEKEWAEDGYTVRRVSYLVEADERAHGYLAIPSGPKPAGGFPAVLCIHGTTNWGARQTLGLLPEPGDTHGGRAINGLDYARNLAQNGFVTLTAEHFCSATRCPAEGPYDTAAFYRKHPKWAAVGKSVYENRIGVGVLAALPEVNASRIGATGHSLGGHNSFFLAALDERVKCAVPCCAGPTIGQNPDAVLWSRDFWYIYFPTLRAGLLKGAPPPVDFHEIFALAAPTPMLEIFGFNDGDARMQTQRLAMHMRVHDVYRLLGREEAHAILVLGDGHSLPDQARTAQLAWLTRWLKHDGDPLGTWKASPQPPSQR